MKLFEVRGRDGRIIRHAATDLASLKAALVSGYDVTAEVFGADANDAGGYSIPIDGPSLMAILLANHGEELRAWLLGEGVKIAKSEAKIDDARIVAALRRSQS